MAISNDLFLAILSMDSYNRVYNQGLKLDETIGQIGNAQLGIATNPDIDLNAVAASFFAQSYTWNGQTIISYRGTDTSVPTGLDLTTGWPIAFGSYSTEQAQLAAPARAH